MEYETSKIVAGVGAILLAIGGFTPILALIGLILLLIGLKGLSEAYRDDTIFTNALYAVIIEFIGLVVFIVLIGASMFGMGLGLGLGGRLHEMGAGLGFLAGLFIGLVVLFIFLVVAAVFFRKSFDTLAAKSGEKLFGTAGLLILIGAVLTIILVGAIILLVAWIIAAIAFFSAKPPAQEQPQAAQAPPPLP